MSKKHELFFVSIKTSFYLWDELQIIVAQSLASFGTHSYENIVEKLISLKSDSPREITRLSLVTSH